VVTLNLTAPHAKSLRPRRRSALSSFTLKESYGKDFATFKYEDVYGNTYRGSYYSNSIEGQKFTLAAPGIMKESVMSFGDTCLLICVYTLSESENRGFESRHD
jgi:hypothetical protein